jgi:hypothetical protein
LAICQGNRFWGCAPSLYKFAQPTKPIFVPKVHVFVDFMEEILARELSTAETKSAQRRVK